MTARFRLRAPLERDRQHPAERLYLAAETVIEFAVTKHDLVTAFSLVGHSVKLVDAVDLGIDGIVTDAPYGLCEVTIPPDAYPESKEVYAELRIIRDADSVVVGKVGYRFFFQIGAM